MFRGNTLEFLLWKGWCSYPVYFHLKFFVAFIWVDGQFQFLHCPMQVCELHWPGSGVFGSSRHTFSNESEAKINWVDDVRAYVALSCVAKACNIFQFRGSSKHAFSVCLISHVRNSPPGWSWEISINGSFWPRIDYIHHSLTLPKKSSKIPRLFMGVGFSLWIYGFVFMIFCLSFLSIKKGSSIKHIAVYFFSIVTNAMRTWLELCRVSAQYEQTYGGENTNTSYLLSSRFVATYTFFRQPHRCGRLCGHTRPLSWASLQLPLHRQSCCRIRTTTCIFKH